MILSVLLAGILSQAAPASNEAPTPEARWAAESVTVVPGADGRPAALVGAATETPRTGADFYVAVNRRDLAIEYRVRRAWRRAGPYVGPLVAGTSALLAWNYRRDRSCGDAESFSWSTCGSTLAARDRRALLVGGGGVALGAGITVVALLLGEHPVDAARAAELADEHNAKLRARLGLPPIAAAPPPARFGLALLDGGAGIAFGGAF